MSLIERFWRNVDKCGPIPPHCPELGPCWTWTGYTNHGRYGYIKIQGKHFFAHRVSAQIHMGFDLDSPLRVLHKCDNERCVNPDHLFIGTQKVNVEDAIAKFRFANVRTLVCRKGHRYTPQNTIRLPNGRRLCKICRRDASIERYRRTHTLLTQEQRSELQRLKGRKSWSNGQPNRVTRRDENGKFTRNGEANVEIQAR